MLVRDGVRPDTGLPIGGRPQLVEKLSFAALALALLVLLVSEVLILLETRALEQRQAADLDISTRYGAGVLHIASAIVDDDLIQLLYQRELDENSVALGDLRETLAELAQLSLLPALSRDKLLLNRLSDYISLYSRALASTATELSLDNIVVDKIAVRQAVSELLRRHVQRQVLLAEAAPSRRAEFRTVEMMSMLVIFLALLVLLSTFRKYRGEIAAAKLSGADYGSLLNNASEPLILCSSRGRVMLASAEAERLLGFDVGGLNGADLRDVVPKRSQQQFKLFRDQLSTGLFKGRPLPRRDMLLLGENDEEIPVSLSLSSLNDGSDAVLLGIRDLRDERALSQLLRQKQQRFMMALSVTKDGYWEWGAESDQVFFSHAWQEMTGYYGSDDESAKQIFDKIIDRKDRLDLHRRIHAFIKTPKNNETFRHRLRRKDGKLIDVRCNVCVQRDQNGRVLRMVGVHSDVGEISLMRSELSRLRERIMTDEKSISHQAANTQADNAKSVFLSLMGHELRTPMNGVVGMADLLSKTELSTEQKMMTSTINRSAQGLLTVLDDILDYAKLEARDLILEPDEFNLQGFIEDIAESLAPTTSLNGQEFVLHFAPGLPRVVLADQARLRQIIENLLGNAIKFCSRSERLGKISLTVKPLVDETFKDGRPRLEILVDDNGIGIDESAREQLFKPFVQQDAGRARRYDGSGLGLTISSRLVGLMGGEIQLKERPGPGCLFSVTLPVEEVSARLEEKPSLAVSVSICVADPLLRAAIQATLVAGGFSVETCTAESLSKLVLVEKFAKKGGRRLIIDSADLELYRCCEELGLPLVVVQDRRDRVKVYPNALPVLKNPVLPSALKRSVSLLNTRY